MNPPLITVGGSGGTNIGQVNVAIDEALVFSAARSLSGLVGLWDYRHTNVSGGKITQWNDLSGNNNHLTNGNATYQFTWNAAGAIPPTSTTTHVDRGYALTSSLILDRRASTVIVVRPTVPTFTREGNASESLCFVGGNGYFKTANRWEYPRKASQFNDALNMIAFVNGTASVKTFSNRIRATETVQTAGTETFTRLFATETGSFPWISQVSSVIVFNRALEDYEIELVFNDLAIRELRERVLVVRGDSIAYGLSATTNADRWADIVAAQRGLSLLNGGESGETAAGAVSKGSTIDSAYNVGGRSAVVVITYGTNDLLAHGAVATLQTNIQTIAGWWRARYLNKADVKVVICSIIPATSGFSGGQTSGDYETDRLAYRTWLLANYVSFADAVCDVGDPASLLGNSANAATYLSDGIHPNTAGHLLYAAAVNTATGLIPLVVGGGTSTARIKHGVATLVEGTVTVSDTTVTAISRIFPVHIVVGGTQGILNVGTRVAGTSFTIASSSVLDTSTVAWFMVEP